jgi:hypothetical protein
LGVGRGAKNPHTIKKLLLRNLKRGGQGPIRAVGPIIIILIIIIIIIIIEAICAVITYVQKIFAVKIVSHSYIDEVQLGIW